MGLTAVTPAVVVLWAVAGVGVALSGAGSILWLLAGVLIGVVVAAAPLVEVATQS